MSMIRNLSVAAAFVLAVPVAHAQYYPGQGQGGVVRCESSNGRTAQCPADTRYGLRLARQLSDSACIEGRTWGTNRSGVWVSGGCRAEFVMGDGRRYGNGNGYGQGGGSRFVCESRDGRQNYCAVNGGGRVRVYRQISDSRCDEGRTWGQDRRGVWVSGGCRAEFVTTGYGGGWNDRDDNRGNQGSYGTGYGIQGFRCESNDGRQKFCNVDTSNGVRLVRRLSDSACIEGRSWGVARGGVWVSQGCRADFATGR